VITFISIMHAIAYALSCFIFIIMMIWTNQWRRFFRLRLWLILKSSNIRLSTIFKFFLTAFLYSRIVSAKWTFLSIALFCKIQLSQNVEAHFRSTIKNFSTNIVSKSKKSLMSKVRMRLLRFSQSATQVSIWFLNDDCFNAWNFSCNCFFIWSSIFLYLMIKNCNISFMKADIISKRIYDFAKTRIVSFILSILWEILTINFSFRLYSFTFAL
jgi:hypothetical protein